MFDIFSKVLFIGPKNPYGGIGAVLNTYKNEIPNFNFIETHKDQTKVATSFYFLYSIIRIAFYLSIYSQIKIVHIHSASKGSFIRKIIVAMLAKGFNKKVIFHMHGGQFKEYFRSLTWSRSFIITLLNKVDILICLTEEWASFFKTELSLQHIVVIGNPIKIHPILIQKTPSEVLSLLFLGTINKKKGIFDLLNYIHTNIHFKHKKINLKIGGIGEVEFLNEIISDSKFLSQIEYLGFINGDQKIQAIQSCDIFILPSYYEGLPVSILEVLGHGKPVIGTRVGGVPSVVKQHVNGWLFDAGDFKQLDSIFDEIVNHQYPLDQFQKNAYDLALNYSTSKIVMQLSNEYNKLIS